MSTRRDCRLFCVFGARNVFIFLTIILSLLNITESLKTCNTKAGQKPVPCDHGECSPDGSCKCQPCWTGEYCDVLVNKYAPEFDTSEQDVTVSKSVQGGDKIHQVQATDSDYKTTCKNQRPCDCANITYSIHSGNEGANFMIDPNTGVISLVHGVQHSKAERFSLQILAKNLASKYADYDVPSRQPHSMLSVHILIPGKKQNLPHLTRHKRFAPSENIPKKTAFSLEAVGTNLTKIAQGSTLSFELFIHLAQGTTDMLVEIFTPDNQTDIFSICNPVISEQGSNIDFVKTAPKLVQSTTSNLRNRAIIDLGNVTNSGKSKTSYKDSIIKIDFTFIVVDDTSAASVVDKTFWISTGIEYNSKNDVWVGQESYIATSGNVAGAKEISEFNLTGPSEMPLESSAVFDILMTLKYFKNNVKIDVFSPLNVTSAINLCDLSLKDIGKNFACFDEEIVKSQLIDSEIENEYNKGHIDLGYLINIPQASKPVNDNDTILLQFSAKTSNDTSLVGQKLYVGAAAMVGSNTIWTTRRQVEITSPQPLTQAPTVHSSLNFTALRIRKSETLINSLNLITSDEGMAEIIVNVSLHAPSKTHIEICKVAVVSHGKNIPCIGKEQNLKINSAKDEAVLDLGKVHTVKSGSSVSNQIVLDIIVKSKESTPKATYPIDVIVSVNSKITNQSSYTVTVTNDSVLVPSDNLVKPSCSFVEVNNKENLFKGENAKMKFNITFPTGLVATFPQLTIEVFVPELSGKYVMSICDAYISHIGNNMPCLDRQIINENITFKTEFVQTVNESQKMKIGLKNMCLTNFYQGPYDNTITLDVMATLLENIATTKAWISAGLYSGKQLWVGQLGFTENTGVVPDVKQNGPQRFDLIDIKNISISPFSYILAYGISIKIPPLSVAEVTVDVSSDSSDLSICTVRYMKRGSDIGCFDNVTTEEKQVDSSLKKSVKLDLKLLTNVGPHGIHQSSYFDKSTVLLQTFVEVSGASTNTLTVAVKFGTKAPIERKIQIEGAPTVPGISTTQVVKDATSSVGAITENGTKSTNLAKGEMKRILTEFFVEPEVFQKMKFLTKIDKSGAKICNFNIIYGGTNLPCLDKIKTKSTKISDQEYSIETNVCSWPIDMDSKDSNKIILETIVQVPRSSSLVSGNNFNVITDIYMASTKYLTTSQQLSLVDTFNEEFMPWMTTDNTTDFIVLNGTPATGADVGQVLHLNVVLSIPTNSSSRVKLTIDTQTTTSAHLTIQNIKYIKASDDIACSMPNMELLLNSTLQTSQNNKGVIDFGIVTNTGLTSRLLQPSVHQYFGEIEVVVTFQMADAPENSKDSEKSITMQLDVGRFKKTFEHKVKVQRTADNAPNIYLKADIDDKGMSLSGFVLTINATMRLENTSTAELRPGSAIFYLPLWVQYAGAFVTNKIGVAPNETFNAKTGKLEFKFSEFFFTDDVKFSFNISRKDFSGSKSLLQATTPYEAVGRITHHTTSKYKSDRVFSSPMSAVTFTVQLPPAPNKCGGLLTIDDSQITVDNLGSTYQNKEFKVSVRSGMYAEERFLQVYFGNKVKVERLSITPQHRSNDAVKMFKFSYSDDGFSWVSGDKINIGSQQHNISISRARESRYLRFHILQHMGKPGTLLAVKLDFYGCETTSDKSSITRNVPKPDPNGWYYRGFIEAESKIYACDVNPKKHLRMNCYYSQDGTTWHPLDPRLGNVNVYDKEKKIFYGISNDKVSYMASKNGFEWFSVDKSKMVKLMADCQSAKCVKASKVPWNDGAVSGSNTLPVEMTNWGANSTGIFKKDGVSWKRVADWSQCAP